GRALHVHGRGRPHAAARHRAVSLVVRPVAALSGARERLRRPRVRGQHGAGDGRHPEVFAAAASSSPPSDWRNYDTIYTERYMWTPEGNAAGYEAGSALTYVKDLKGRLLIYFGTADNNVHPTNSLQIIKGLQAAGKSFDLQVGP